MRCRRFLFWLAMQRLLIVLLVFWSLAQSAEWYELYHLYQQDSRSTVRDSIRTIVKANLKNPEYAFVGGLIEPDGEKALLIYRDVFSNYPLSSVADNALLKIIEYLYTKGLYVKTVKYSQELLRAYPASECVADAGYFLLSSFVAMNKPDSVDYYRRFLSEKYPAIDFSYSGIKLQVQTPAFDTVVTTNKPSAQPTPPQRSAEPIKTGGLFTLQFGAFSVPQNAAVLQNRLRKAGYSARIESVVINGRQLSAVRVGDFATRSEAQTIGEKIKREQSLDFVVVKK